MAGGWFFLMVSEAFVLGEHDFRLPGLGSYMSLAIERGDGWAQLLGVLAMLGMIVFVDQVVWRPLVAWSHKFTDEETTEAPGSWLWERIRAVANLAGGVAVVELLSTGEKSHSAARPRRRGRSKRRAWDRAALDKTPARAPSCGRAIWRVKYAQPAADAHGGEWLHLFGSTAATFSARRHRGGAGFALDDSRGRADWPSSALGARPATRHSDGGEFPGTDDFPVVVGVMLASGIGLGISSVVLLLLGTQWYILFNVIAGSSAIPRELWEVSRLSRFSWRQRWQTAHFARHLSQPAHRLDHRDGRRVERQHRRRIHEVSRSDAHDHGTGRGDQRGDGTRRFSTFSPPPWESWR
jgi:NitT/TauT family transport system permease protein